VPERLSDRASDVPFEYAAAVGLGLVMVFLVALAIWKRDGALPDSIGGESTAGLEAERARLARATAGLEKALEDGAISEEYYRRRRRELSARLAAISSRQGR
jgi:hypothetical protein